MASLAGRTGTGGRERVVEQQGELVAWVRGELCGAELVRTRERPWASVWRVETPEGRWWLKVAGMGTAHEPGLLRRMQDLRSPLLPQVRSHAEQPWLLVADAGSAVRDRLAEAGSQAVLAFWCDLLAGYAELQQAFRPGWAAEVGLPDARPDVLPARLAEVLAEPDWWSAEVAPDLTPTDLERIRRCGRPLAEAAEALAGSRASTVQHDDLHGGNVLLPGPDGPAVIIDWGDAVLGHPFGTLLVTLGALAAELGLPDDDPGLGRVRDAYL